MAKIQVPVGSGLGVQQFSIKPGGGLQMGEAIPPAPVTPETPAFTPEQTPAPTPFQRLYPGVDPGKVEMALDDKGKLRLRPIETPVETPAPIAPVVPAVPAAPPNDDFNNLKAQLEQQSQLMTAMLQAQMSGRPLMEVLSGIPAAPAEPDYSDLDLDDAGDRAIFAKRMREDALAMARAEVQAQMRGVTPSIQNAQRHGEYFAVSQKHGKDPGFEQKAALVDKLVAGNPNISYEATYNLVSTIQQSLGGPAQPATPAAEPKEVTLTPAQAEAKAAQAAKYPASSGGRAIGAPVMPPELAKKGFKVQAAWVAQQIDRGWTEADLVTAAKSQR